ncbi:hypothetical protein HF324_33355 [Chitinophaga oryzae]|uniref:Uncharacterized protein n=1 Tax=Chitinophaga oryzae TaxID=2725414 RepID=A0ABX6TS64_9BACT|nr:hypothetical protein HF324_33355 [Chitinophaga oryzae]
MEHTWDILTYLIDGCAISIFLFLIAAVFIPALKNVRSTYLRIANTTFSILGLIALGISIVLYSTIAIDLRDNELLGFLSHRAKFILAGLLLLGIVPIMALFGKRVTQTGFTCLLLIVVIIITHIDATSQWLTNLTGFYSFPRGHLYEAPIVKWYRLLIALLFFIICYWFTRRKISRA